MSLQEMVIKEPRTSLIGDIDPQMALQALKVKARIGRRAKTSKRDAALVVPLNQEGKIHHTQDMFINEQEISQDGTGLVIKEEQVMFETFSIIYPSVWNADLSTA